MHPKLEVHCEKTRLRDIRAFVEESLKSHRYITEELVYELVTAVDEVCANMMIHANNCNPTQSIGIEIQVDHAEGITFVITDRGISFNYNAYKEPDMESIIKTKKKGGLGMMIVKKVMDKVEFSTNNKMNKCILFRKL